MSSKSKDLDTWAYALGANNDTEAIAALNQKSTALLVIANEINRMRRQLQSGGVRDSDPVLDEILTAAAGVMDAGLALGRLRVRFARHERGAA